MTAYSAGLRASELVNLKITDIDPARMTLRIRQGKGGKDRYAILSENLLVELRVYYATGLRSGFSLIEPRTAP
jgi:site-specific recombinase XerD